ncbi:MAG: hypothetical protein A2Y78_07630 [Acidobacteria bacterium RBG_13_68_16]|nr:MAG: hypothetical protein A2Y78_07630 [Acidobacteria bacterium RBG_13_68_16]
MVPGQMRLEKPGLEVAGVLYEQLVAEMVREPPATLSQGPHDLGAECGNQRIVLLRLVFPPNHLTQDRGHHVRSPL